MTTETKEPLALTVKGREPEHVVAWACGTCRYVKHTEQEARNCCAAARCATPGCGGVTEKRWSMLCPSCEKLIEEGRAKERAEKVAALYEKAKKVPLAQYYGPLYWEDSIGGDWGEGYYSDIDALLDHCESAKVEPPPWAWACAPKRLAIDARDLIDRECEEQEMHEDAAEGVSGIEELQAFLDKWCEKNAPTSYEPNESIAVDISAEVEAWKKEREAVACHFCGATDWETSATLIRCKGCGVLWGRVNGSWVLDPDTAPKIQPAEGDPPTGTVCHHCAGFVNHPLYNERCIRKPGCVGIPAEKKEGGR